MTASARNLVGATIEPASRKGTDFANAIAHDALRLTATLLKISDNRLLSRAALPSFPYANVTAGEAGQHGQISHGLFSRRATAHLFCGAGETFSLPMMLLPELTPRAFIEHTRLNELWRTSTSVKVAADLCTSQRERKLTDDGY